jgi:1,4-dihydroxy-2-naphthoyl-CoA hydrolase
MGTTSDRPTPERSTGDQPADERFPSFDPELAAFMVGTGDEPGMGLDEGLAAFLRMRVVEATPGEVVVEVPVRDELLHRFGAAHGGVVATLADQALGSVVFPLVPLGTWPATLEFKINYLAGVRTGLLRAVGRVASLRKRTAVVTVEVDNLVDGEHRLVAVAQGTISLNPPRAGGGPTPVPG